jgi:hypothetical protein
VVKANDIFFNADQRIQIADFSPIRLETGEVEPFSGKRWAPTADVSAFVSLLCEIARRAPVTPPIGAADGPPLPAAVRAFVWRMIEDRRSPESVRRRLKENHFEITTGVDSDEVSAFVSWAESLEQAMKRQ